LQRKNRDKERAGSAERARAFSRFQHFSSLNPYPVELYPHGSFGAGNIDQEVQAKETAKDSAPMAAKPVESQGGPGLRTLR
jgi:hypothetical protein